MHSCSALLAYFTHILIVIQVNLINSNFPGDFGLGIQYFHVSPFISPMHETGAIRTHFALRDLGRDPHTWEMLNEGRPQTAE